MDRLRIAGASINQTPMDWEGNVARLTSLIREARAQKVQVMCFPELCITAYNCEDTFSSVHTARRSILALEQLMQETEIECPFCGESCSFWADRRRETTSRP